MMRLTAEDVLAQRAAIDGMVAGTTICSAFAATAERDGSREALRWRGENGWQSLTWRQYREQVRNATLALDALGLPGAGSVAVILGRNSPRHVMADLAIVHLGATPVSLYNTLAPEQLSFALDHCQAEVAFVDADSAHRIESCRSAHPRLRAVVVLDGERASTGNVLAWDALQEAGRRQHERHPGRFDQMAGAVRPGDPAMLIYTSGTSGTPRAVIHTHRSALWTLEALDRMAKIDADDRLVSYLPLAHSAERWWSHWRGVLRGPATSFCSDADHLLETLRDVRPTWFLGVPRVWEKLAAAIAARLDAEPDRARRRTLQDAVAVGREMVRHDQDLTPVPPARRAAYGAARPVLARILAGVGLDQCRVAITGAAPISADVVELFHALGLRLSEGWGMTEVLVGTWNGIGRIKIGTVGVPLPGVEARLAPDGELLVRGGNVMAGYLGDPAADAGVLDADGWIRSGDLAAVDGDGYYRIVGRKHDLVITAGGKNVSPALLENLLERDPLVAHACLAGDRRPYLCALISLAPAATRAWAREAGIADTDMAELAVHPLVRARVGRAVEATNRQVSRPEQVKRFTIVTEEWTVGGGELTPTLKLKRSVVLARHAGVIDVMYGDQ
jgi:long-chain acyl-CoA synthetase